MVVMAEAGDPRTAAPETPESATLKLRVPENGVALLTATVKVFVAESPLAQLRVPLLAV